MLRFLLVLVLFFVSRPAFAQEEEQPSKLNPSVDVYANYESLDSDHLKLHGSSIGPSFRVSHLAPRISAFEIGGRSSFYVWRSLYAGFDLGLGGGSFPAGRLRDTPPVTTESGAVHVRIGAVVGVTSPRFGPFDVRGEVTAGGRIILVDVEERYGCTHDGCDGLSAEAWMVQPKAVVEFWLAPNATLGAYFAGDIAQPGDWAGGIFFGYHPYANDNRK